MSDDHVIVKRGTLFSPSTSQSIDGSKTEIVKSIAQAMCSTCLTDWVDTITKMKSEVPIAVVIRSAHWDPNLTKKFLSETNVTKNTFEENKIKTSFETVEDLRFEITEKEHLDRLSRFVTNSLETNTLAVICCDMKYYPFRYYAFHVLIGQDDVD